MGSAKTKGRTEQAYPKHPFLLPIDETASQLNTNFETGLNDVKARELLQLYGENRLEGEGGVKWYSILAKQVSNAMVLVSTLVSNSVRPKAYDLVRSSF
jgi:Na+-exporting ATPase